MTVVGGRKGRSDAARALTPRQEISRTAQLSIANPHSLSSLDRAANKLHTSTTSSSANTHTAKMGRVRTKTVKKSAKVIIERYYPKLTLDFETNKRICDEIAIIASKRLRNKVRTITTTFTSKSAKF